jgi:Ni/Fe-hydrogenase subunit HybB-like protein
LWISLVVAVSLELLELLHLAYEAGSEWDVLRTLLTERLNVPYLWIQVLIGSVPPLILLPIAIKLKGQPRVMSLLAALSSVLVIVQVFAMRWNVVIGGQLFSKSFRGFVEYNLLWTGREGLLAAIVVLALPLVALLTASRLLPLWESE